MRLLCDFHHPQLFESYRLTLEDRLHYEVYRMIGMDWYDKGYWTFEKNWAGDKYAKMFLNLRQTDRQFSDHWEREDEMHPGRTFKMLTYEQALAMKPNYVLTSVSHNHYSFDPFVRKIGATHIIQVGNNEHYVDWKSSMIGLISTAAQVPTHIRKVKYSPEFDTKNYFYHSPVPVDGPVSSFILVWHQKAKTLGLMNYVADQIPDRPFYIYGEEGQVLETTPLVAERMQEIAALWHTKAVGDGYGFVIHAAAAIGRPIIGMRQFYVSTRAEYLWNPKNSLNLDSMKPEVAAKEVSALLNDPDRLMAMGEKSYELFKSHVDFEADAAKIKKLLEA